MLRNNTFRSNLIFNILLNLNILLLRDNIVKYKKLLSNNGPKALK